MHVVCLDLEGVLIPEMWIAVAEATATEDLRLTTRDIADYDQLMRHRIAVLERRRITMADIRNVTRQVEPLPGAPGFLRELRRHAGVVILSDTFAQFMTSVMAGLDHPLLLCNELVVDERDRVVDYRLRQQDGKRMAVRAFRSMNVTVSAVGDSFNDISMIRAADRGCLFRPSDTVAEAHPDLPRAHDHAELLALLIGGRPVS